MNLLIAVVAVWTLVDQWPFRWLAWVWLIIVSLPFLAMVLAIWSLIATARWIAAPFSHQRGQAVEVESMAEEP
jgi:hypothetical protein